ncbi:MAG: ArsB/NhaD family transporter [candidate division WOR-3 bacterium]|jgi:Na+/H+ antiporter NhaD/arsenite permease-like protein|nr:ArsB/NhaD family transporter [candidate division WOR-3 bacterium]
MTPGAWIAAAIFIASYIAIATEKIDRTIVALVGAALMLILGLIDQTNAFRHIDLNVIFLLAGMMIIVSIVKRCGLFEWLALSTAKMTAGKPVLLLVTLSLVTAIVSAFLDNVTTMMLIAPMTLLIADALRIDPVPLLISETMASNIGGAATLIGDPPNLLVGSAANLSFLDFLANMAPLVLLVLIAFLLMGSGFFGRPLRRSSPNVAALASLEPRKAIKDSYLLWKSIVVLAVVFVAFMLHGALDVKPATVALGGAALLLLISQLPPKRQKIDPIETLLAEIDWPTLFFFIGMFIMIAGLEATGVIGVILNLLTSLTGRNLLLTSMIIMWGAALLTMVTSAVPFVLAMIPVIGGLAAQGIEPIEPLWWSLALGACLGANGTIIGSAANMVVAGISNRSGHKITFRAFTSKGLPITAASLVLASLYVWLRYFVFAGN